MVDTFRKADTVSVVIPCYNGERFLSEAVASALGQTRPPLEVIVVDDGSTDRSAELAMSLGPTVRVIRQSNQGESVARNRGIDEARGEWIAFLDADDSWMPGKLEQQVVALSPRTRAICTGTRRGSAPDAEDTVLLSPKPHELTAASLCVNGMVCHISSLLVSRDVSARFPSWTQFGEDLVYGLDVLEETAIEVVEEPLVFYRRHSASQSAVQKDISFRYYDTLAAWIALAPERRSTLTPAVLRRLTSRADAAFWKRDWPVYDRIAAHISLHYANHPDAAETLRRDRFPRWMYGVKDWFDRLVNVS